MEQTNRTIPPAAGSQCVSNGCAVDGRPSLNCHMDGSCGSHHGRVGWGVALCIVLLLLTGCGYTIQGRATLPFPSVSIDKINNRTYEPEIDDRMREILTEELIRKGFVVNRSSDYKISGSLNSFELRTLSEKAGVAVEYEVVIKGEFNLKTPSGAVKNLRSEGPFIVSFSSAERLQDVMAFKERAIEKALRDLSRELIISILW